MAQLTRRALLCAPAFVRGRYALFAQSGVQYSDRAIRLVGETCVVDLLSQFRFAHQTEKPPTIETWLNDPRKFSADDVAVYQKSGIRVFALGHGPGDYAQAVRYFARWNGFLAARSDVLMRISQAADFERARRERKIGLMLTFQDSTHFRGVDDVPEFYGLGQRIAQLTYNHNNRIGSGFLENRDGGLSAFGHSLMQRMEQVGMAVDASHCGDQTTLDALDAAKRPVLFTHATCRGLLAGHLRTKTDEMIRKMAKTGGVMGVAFIRFMVRGEEPVGISAALDHFDYVRRLVGVQHVAVGSDLDVLGFGQPMGVTDALKSISAQPNFDRYRYHVAKPDMVGVDGLDHPMRVFALTDGLISRGYSDEDIRLVLGGNAIRVLSGVWR